VNIQGSGRTAGKFWERTVAGGENPRMINVIELEWQGLIRNKAGGHGVKLNAEGGKLK